MDDTDRYPWSVPVSAMQGQRLLKVGTQNGRVVTQSPPFGDFSVEPDQADQISAFYAAAAERARRERYLGTS